MSGAWVSALTRSKGLFDQIFVQWLCGKLAKAQRSSLASLSMSATTSKRLSSWLATWSSWASTEARSGWAKIVLIKAETIWPWAFGTLTKTFLMKWTRQRCQAEPTRTS